MRRVSREALPPSQILLGGLDEAEGGPALHEDQAVLVHVDGVCLGHAGNARLGALGDGVNGKLNEEEEEEERKEEVSIGGSREGAHEAPSWFVPRLHLHCRRRVLREP